MFIQRKYEDENFYMLRLTARVFAVACLAILFLLILGENLDHWLKAPAGELIGALLFPVGLIIGLLIAWRRELLGGLLALGSVAAFYVVYGLILNSLLTGLGWWFIFFAIPGALFLAYGIAATGGQELTENQSEISKLNFYRILIVGFDFVSRKARRLK